MKSGDPSPRIAKLHRSHQLDAFDCGTAALDEHLRRYALLNQGSGGARTYVAAIEARVVGYYSLATARVELSDAPERVRKGLARHPVPMILLARLAVDRTFQGRGLGAALLQDALLRTLNAAEIVGVRALIVHAKDAKARDFYRHFDFEPSPVDPLHLFLLMKEVARIAGG